MRWLHDTHCGGACLEDGAAGDLREPQADEEVQRRGVGLANFGSKALHSLPWDGLQLMLLPPADIAQVHGRVRRSAGRRNRRRSVDTHQRVHAKGDEHLQGFTPQAAPPAARLCDHDLRSRRSAGSAKVKAACLRHPACGAGARLDLPSGPVVRVVQEQVHVARHGCAEHHPWPTVRK